MTDQPTPTLLRPEDVTKAARVIARAFAWHEPWGAWTFPDERIREDSLQRLAMVDLGREAVPAGCAWTIDAVSVAIWFPPTSHSAARFFGDGRRSDDQYAVYGKRADLVRESDALIESMRPNVDHWYLDTLATDPDRFGEGLAGRLLDHGCARCDERGEAIALDTHTERNQSFYGRRGFVEIARSRLPGDGPEVAMMLREPR